jgi:hypothetical protein
VAFQRMQDPSFCFVFCGSATICGPFLPAAGPLRARGVVISFSSLVRCHSFSMIPVQHCCTRTEPWSKKKTCQLPGFVSIFFKNFFPTTIRSLGLHTQRKLVCFRGSFLHQKGLFEGFFWRPLSWHLLVLPIRAWSLTVYVCSSERRTKAWGVVEYNQSLPSIWTPIASIDPLSILDRLCL